MTKLSYLLFSFLGFFISKNLLAQEFKYKSVLYCGEKKYKDFIDDINLKDKSVSYINTDNAGRFVIWTDGVQFPSFSKNNQYTLYNQTGMTAYATMESTNQFIFYKLNIDGNRKKIIRIDKLSMAYISRIENYTPYVGSCEWLIDENGKDLNILFNPR
jgi:hypothetical protein